MINDRSTTHSFKQQTFPREKIFYIRNEGTNERFGKTLSISTLQDYALSAACPQADSPQYFLLTVLHISFVLLSRHPQIAHFSNTDRCISLIFIFANILLLEILFHLLNCLKTAVRGDVKSIDFMLYKYELKLITVSEI